ncbi:peroxiredoxin [Desulfopila sp. IMCC35008]|uniref:peroxiredoxin family protein n=1 Tax=Desulfopila sp. IMCC35008 TaxID=2653858 RepID=UPI0013D8D812|nr:redoxin domain-containing protein [Desulfopila sp. IMCC35008]
MKKLIVIVLTLISGMASAEVRALRNIGIGDTYLPFCGQQLKGEQVCSSKYEDNILVVSFVKMGQKNSRKVLLEMQELYTLYKMKNVSLIGIVSGETDVPALVAYAEKNKLTLPLLVDEDRDLYGSFGVVAYPTIAVFGRNQKLQYVFGSNIINIKKRVEGCVKYLLGDINITELERILHPVVEKGDPQNATLERYYNFSKNLYKKQHYSQAKKIVTFSLNNFPDHALSYCLYGDILIQEKNYQLALKQFEHALELDPHLEEAKAGRQICLDKLEN